MKKIVLLIALVLPFFTMSCGKDSSPKPQIKLSELGIELDQSNLTAMQKSLIKNINSDSVVDLKEVTNSVLERHFEAYMSYTLDPFNADQADYKAPYRAEFKKILKDMDSTPKDKLHDFKMSYEDEISRRNESEDLLYNKDHVSVFSPLSENRIQCYSGTVLFNVLYQMAYGSDFHAQNLVFIYENAHVLPGYVKDVSGENHLFGVETTVKGKALKIFGPVKDLRGVRVVDAHLAMGLESFSGKILNSQSVLQKALTKTAELYDLPLTEMEESLTDVLVPFKGAYDNSRVAQNTSKYLNSSIFSHGDSSVVPTGDLERLETDELKANSTYSSLRDLFLVRSFYVTEEEHRESSYEEELLSDEFVQMGDILSLKTVRGYNSVLMNDLFTAKYFQRGTLLYPRSLDLNAAYAEFDASIIPSFLTGKVEFVMSPQIHYNFLCLSPVSSKPKANGERESFVDIDCKNKIKITIVNDMFNADFPVVSGPQVSVRKKLQFSKAQIKHIFEPFFKVDVLRCVDRRASSSVCRDYIKLDHKALIKH